MAVAIVPLMLACVPAASNIIEVQPATAQKSNIDEVNNAAGASGSNRIEAEVTKVIDGDTIEVSIKGVQYKLRYIGVDAPEPDSIDTNTRNIAMKAADKNSELVRDRTVEIEKDVSETDRYGRLLRYVYAGGFMVNAELVKCGYAQAVSYPPDIKYQSLFSSLQAGAKASKVGLWGSSGYYSAPMPTEKGIYVGSKKSNKYHYPSCIWAQQIAADNEIWFSSGEEAKSGGYIPCKVCRPPQ
ncbi:MAG: thermonuclease family protein [Chloroflexi bacterium]|nr:thermonuclease family protein [Chloroflexota bacterium]